MEQDAIGQGYNAIWLATDDELVEVYTIEKAAKQMGYSEKYTSQLCSDLKLIATKISGRWFPHRNSCDLYGFEPLDDLPF